MPLAAINPSRMDRRVSLRSPLRVRGVAGGWVETFVEAAVVWAEWVHAGTREFQAAAAQNAETTGAFRVRWRADVSATWVVVWEGNVWEVIGREEIGRRSGLLLTVRALNPAPAGVNDQLQAFDVALAEGEASKAVTYPTAFSGAPRAVWVQLVVPSGGFTFNAAVVAGSVTASGFTVELGAGVPGAGYSLKVIAIK